MSWDSPSYGDIREPGQWATAQHERHIADMARIRRLHEPVRTPQEAALDLMRDALNRIARGSREEYAEPWFLDEEFQSAYGSRAIAAHWRKPLRIDEINLMADTPDVRSREGRP